MKYRFLSPLGCYRVEKLKFKLSTGLRPGTCQFSVKYTIRQVLKLNFNTTQNAHYKLGWVLLLLTNELSPEHSYTRVNKTFF